MTRNSTISRFLSLIPALLVCFAVIVANSEDGETKSEAKNKEDTITREALQSSLPRELTQLFPVGREIRGIAIPSYSGDTLKTVIRAESVRRVDDQYLDFLNLVIHVYNSAGLPDTIITMPEAAYDLVIGELASLTPSSIEQSQFSMTGDKMVFETRSQVSRMVGNVKIVISDVEKLVPGFGPAAEGEPEEAGK